MCPYFWTYVVVILLLPFILIVKAFGKAGTELLNKLRTYKQDKETRLVKALTERCKAVQTPEEAYKLVKSKCWKKFRFDLDDFKLRSDIEELYQTYAYELRKAQQERDDAEEIIQYNQREKFEKTKESFKESIITKILGYVFLYSGILALLYGIYRLIVWLCSFTYPAPNWPLIGGIAALILGAAAAVFMIYLIFRYILIPFMSYIVCQLGKVNWSFLSCLKYLKYLGIPLWLLYKLFEALYKLFAIIGSMIYATYKKHCPIITWKEE